MKSTKAIALLSTASALALSASLALADRAVENNTGQSAQLEHMRQDKSEPLSNRDTSNADGISGTDTVADYRRLNLLGQSDALSKTEPYAPLSLINTPTSNQTSTNNKQQGYEATNRSSSRDNRRDW